MKKYTISKKEGWFCYKLDEFDLEEPFEIEVPIDCGCREIVTIGGEFQLPQSLSTYNYNKNFVKENKGKRVSIYSLRTDLIKLYYGSYKLNDYIKNASGNYSIKHKSLLNYKKSNPSLIESIEKLTNELKDKIINFHSNLTKDQVADYADYKNNLNKLLKELLEAKGFSLEESTLWINLK